MLCRFDFLPRLRRYVYDAARYAVAMLPLIAILIFSLRCRLPPFLLFRYCHDVSMPRFRFCLLSPLRHA